MVFSEVFPFGVVRTPQCLQLWCVGSGSYSAYTCSLILSNKLKKSFIQISGAPFLFSSLLSSTLPRNDSCPLSESQCPSSQGQVCSDLPGFPVSAPCYHVSESTSRKGRAVLALFSCVVLLSRFTVLICLWSKSKTVVS